MSEVINYELIVTLKTVDQLNCPGAQNVSGSVTEFLTQTQITGV